VRLAACTAAAALLQLDGTVITVALPALGRGLRVSSGTTSIVLSSYFVFFALALFPGGALVDRFGARRIALWGLALFGVGAAAGAISASIGELVATRAIQGVGAGLVSPAALAGAVSGFPRELRGKALGIWGASAGVANLVGPLLGGLLTMAAGWRANWWGFVPLALVCAVAVVRQVPGPAERPPGDQRGSALNAVVLAAVLVAGLTFAVMIGSFYIAEQYLQRVAHYSALGASSALVIVAFFVAAGAPLTGRLADARGERLPALLGFLAAGSALLVLGIPGVPLAGLVTILPLSLVGLGLGMLFVPTSRAALNTTPLALHGRTSAALSAGRLVGAAVGAGLAGLALAGGPSTAGVHHALLIGGAVCLVVGIPASRRLVARPGPLAVDEPAGGRG
jgi:MFS family permease